MLRFAAARNSREHVATAGPESKKPGNDRKSLPGSELPLLGSNQDSPDPESGVLPVTPRGSDPSADWLAIRGTHVF